MSVLFKQQVDNSLLMDQANILLTAAGAMLSIASPMEIDLKPDSGFFLANYTIGLVPEAMEVQKGEHPIQRMFGLTDEQLRSIDIEIVIVGNKMGQEKEWVVSVADYSFKCTNDEVAVQFANERRALIQNVLQKNIQVSLYVEKAV